MCIRDSIEIDRERCWGLRRGRFGQRFQPARGQCGQVDALRQLLPPPAHGRQHRPLDQPAVLLLEPAVVAEQVGAVADDGVPFGDAPRAHGRQWRVVLHVAEHIERLAGVIVVIGRQPLGPHRIAMVGHEDAALGGDDRDIGQVQIAAEVPPEGPQDDLIAAQ